MSRILARMPTCPGCLKKLQLMPAVLVLVNLFPSEKRVCVNHTQNNIEAVFVVIFKLLFKGTVAICWLAPPHHSWWVPASSQCVFSEAAGDCYLGHSSTWDMLWSSWLLDVWVFNEEIGGQKISFSSLSSQCKLLKNVCAAVTTVSFQIVNHHLPHKKPLVLEDLWFSLSFWSSAIANPLCISLHLFLNILYRFLRCVFLMTSFFYFQIS